MARTLSRIRLAYMELPMRIYGETISHTRAQWEDMLEDMRPECDNARRIRRNLDTHAGAVRASGLL